MKKSLVRSITCFVLTIALTTVASVGRCDSLHELTGRSFHLRTGSGAEITVQIGREIKRKRDYYEVPYKLLISGLHRSWSGIKEEYIDVGKISGSGDYHKFTVSESKLKITIGGDPEDCNEFKTSGSFSAQGQRFDEYKFKYGPFIPLQDLYYDAYIRSSGPWKK